jgi:Ni,Fe-hydrogenase I cytochrome b subunit
MSVRFAVQFPNSSTLTTNVCDNNEQYLLHFSAGVVITNCVWFIVYWKLFNALNCTCGVFEGKLQVICGIGKYKSLCV